jgi:hypothetical protein
MALTFHCIDALTHGPKPPNEDAHGVSPRAAWVIDGATGVSRGPDILEPSGAAWLAETLSDALHGLFRQGTPAPMTATLAAAQAAVAGAFEATVGGAVIEAPDLPTACLGLALLDGERIDLAVIGDIAILHRATDGTVTHLSDHAVDEFSDRTRTALDEVRRLRPTEDPMPHVREQIRVNRLMANQPGGYNVVHPRLAWDDKVTTATHAAADGDVLLVASDGFFRLVDHFGIHTEADLVEAALSQGLAPLLARLRAEEEADPHGVRAPRIKRHDDATAVLLRVTSGGDDTN